MKKNDLMNGDIVVQRDGGLAVVIKNGFNEYFLLQNGGYEFLDDYTDDMTYLYPDGEEDIGDIMQVYRFEHGAAIGFSDYEDEEPVYERDYTWVRPGTQVHETHKHAERNVQKGDEEEMDVNETGKIQVVAQQFYGNRTLTEIRREDVDYFLRGHFDVKTTDVIQNVVRKIVPVPGSNGIVVVFDQTQEDEYVNVCFPELYADKGAEYMARWGEELQMQISCRIPEMSIEIHTRCFACRIEDNGVLQSLESGDEKVFMKYFA